MPCQIVGWLLLQSGCRIGDTAEWINDVTELLGRDYPLLQKPAYVFQLSCYSRPRFRQQLAAKPFNIRAAMFDSYKVHLCDAFPKAAVVRHAKQIQAGALSSSECRALPARLFCNLNPRSPLNWPTGASGLQLRPLSALRILSRFVFT